MDQPAINACLNGLAAVLLVVGWIAVRGRRICLHKACMISAFAVSAVFLASYLHYHFIVRDGRPTRFTTEGLPKTIYLTVLLSHTVLAVAVAVLAPTSLYLGLRDQIDRHRRIARWTMPIWIYVSVTGVVVYLMLYRMYPPE
ncbi:MAG: DUF420 domain-containing protein [Gemmataceae bacterium]|nr:DUF420 domain-containing protein [Gemmataceae bacterium]